MILFKIMHLKISSAKRCSFCLGLNVLTMAIFYRDRRQQLSLFEKMGLPGPKPELLLGNLREVNTKVWAYYRVV